MLPAAPPRPVCAGLTCEDLLSLVARGDGAAFHELYGREMPGVRGLAFRLLRDWSQAEEVAQEVMLALWQRAAQFQAALGGGHAWILRLTRSRAIDRIRMCHHAQIRDHRYARETAGNASAVNGDVIHLALTEVDRGRVQLALLKLSAVQREALVLAFFSRMSYPEIAGQLHIPLGTVKTRIRDALIRLRRILSEDDGELRAA